MIIFSNDFIELYKDALTLSESVGIEASSPQISGRQQHRQNIPAESSTEYYRRNLTIPMLDHLISELDTRFDESSSLYIMEFMQLLPSEVIKNAPSQQQFLHIISLYEDDLPFSRAFGTELDLWVSKWKDSEPSLARELDYLLHSFSPLPSAHRKESRSNPNERQPDPSTRAMPTHSHWETEGSVASSSIYDATAAQLARLPAEVLRLHLSQRNLVSTGSRDALAKRLHGHLRSEGKRPVRPRPDRSRSGRTEARRHTARDRVAASSSGRETLVSTPTASPPAERARADTASSESSDPSDIADSGEFSDSNDTAGSGESSDSSDTGESSDSGESSESSDSNPSESSHPDDTSDSGTRYRLPRPRHRHRRRPGLRDSSVTDSRSRSRSTSRSRRLHWRDSRRRHRPDYRRAREHRHHYRRRKRHHGRKHHWLPAIPGVSPFVTWSAAPSHKLNRRIRRGEYINFNKLLSPQQAPASGILPASRQGVNKPPKAPKQDLATWLEAWNIYATVRIAADPNSASELIKYQTIVSSLFATYRTESCIMYHV